jgi:uncharacterized alpha-E superfamily protein
MLSRIAESFFWIGRYTERCEATARLLAEHHQLLVEDTRVPQEQGVAALLEALDFVEPYGSTQTPAALVRTIMGDSETTSTIRGAAYAARENARAIRDAIPGDLFEALNNLHLFMSSKAALTASPGVGLRSALERLAVVAGVIDWINPRDDAHLFLQLGRALERIDMTGRLLSIHHERIWPESGPTTMLHACGGLGAFLRSGSTPTGPQVREYLVLDQSFPRSMLRCALLAEESVRGLERDGTVSISGALMRTVGILRSTLEYSANDPSEEVVDRLAVTALSAAAEASTQMDEAFFRQVGTIDWSRG